MQKRILVLNLMPKLEEFERQIKNIFSSLEEKVSLTFVYFSNFTKDKEKMSYLKEHYVLFDEVKNQKFDGAIVSGAPLEKLEFEDIFYKKELDSFLDYTKRFVKSTIFICFASLYAIDYFYHIPKINLDSKLSGLYLHYPLNPSNLIKNYPSYFYVPQSRYASLKEEDILLHPHLTLVSKSNDSGVFIVESIDHKQIFVTGHLEYEENTLDEEYKRDLKVYFHVKKPVHYYFHNKPLYLWKELTSLFYFNWVTYYLNEYQ